MPAIPTAIHTLSARDFATAILATDANDFPSVVRDQLQVLHDIALCSQVISKLNDSKTPSDHALAHDLWLAMRFYHMARA